MFFAFLLISRSSYAFCTINSSSVICVTNTLSHFVAYLFTLFTLFFDEKSYLKFHIVESLLWLVVFWSNLKKSFSYPEGYIFYIFF